MDPIMIDGAVIYKIPSEEQLNREEIEQIVSHTANTWQAGRGSAETRRDTVQGKKAEWVLEDFLHRQSRIAYLSYDKFRQDGYKKHAPFDGLLFRKETDPELLRRMAGRINAEVSGSEIGQVGAALRKELEENGIYTMEIKSSSLKERDYEGLLPRDAAAEGEGRTKEAYRQIISNLRRWDFFVYPYYKRTSELIRSFYEYAEYVRADPAFQKGKQGNQAFLRELILSEYDNACDIYTRLYFDYRTQEVYLPGYLKKGAFFEKPQIAHMPGEKSGRALYYMRCIADGQSFLEIDRDIETWQFGDAAAYGRLFAGGQRNCPRCGERLQICNVRKKRAYFYRCYQCDAWYGMNEIDGAEG